MCPFVRSQVTNGLLRAMVAPPAGASVSAASTSSGTSGSSGPTPSSRPAPSGAPLAAAQPPRPSPAVVAAAAEAVAADALAAAVERMESKLPTSAVKGTAEPPCGTERAATLACYKAGGDVLQCGPVVDAFVECAARLR